MIMYVLLSHEYLHFCGTKPSEIFKNSKFFDMYDMFGYCDEVVGLITDDLELDFPNTVKENHMMARFESLDRISKKSIIDKTSELSIKNDCYKEMVDFYKCPFRNCRLREIFYGIFQIDNINGKILNPARIFGANKDRSLVEKRFDMGFKNRSDKKVFKVFKCTTDLNFYLAKDNMAKKFSDNFHCLNLKNKEKIMRLINKMYKEANTNF